MRSFRGMAARWPVSVMCIMAMLVPGLVGVFTPSAAQAQVQTTRVAVVNFTNQSKVPDQMFTSMARDAVVVELLRSGKFDVTPTETLQSEMEKLGYRTKDERSPKVSLTTSMMQKLGQELNVSAIIDGEIVSMEINRAKKTAKVRLAVRMLDVVSGELVNGAVATGSSFPRIGFTGDQDTDWVVEAINDAAAKAIDTMVKYLLPEAYVLHSIDTRTILLNQGSQQGVEAGMNMMVLRTAPDGSDELVARVQISSVTDTDSLANIVWQSRGVKPGDRAKAVYEAPKSLAGTETEGPRGETQRKIQKGKSLLYSAVAMAGLWWLFGKGGSKDETTPGAIAVAGSAPDIQTSASDSAVQIAWNNPQPILYNNILEFHVWRDNSAGSATQGPVLSTSLLAALPTKGNLGSFKHVAIDDTAGRTVDFFFPEPDDQGNMGQGSSSVEVAGVTMGDTHSYYVSTFYQSQAVVQGESLTTYAETTPVFAGTATPLTRPQPTFPGGITSTDTVDLSQAYFQWEGSRSADTYVIELSPYVRFPRTQTYVIGPFQAATSTDGQDMRWPRVGTMNISNVAELKTLPAGTPLFWRVGALCSRDTPGPYPAGTGDAMANGGSKSTRYIYTSAGTLFMFLIAGAE